jgi:Fe-S cluster biosynthesis and repair protein YggX
METQTVTKIFSKVFNDIKKYNPNSPSTKSTLIIEETKLSELNRS